MDLAEIGGLRGLDKILGKRAFLEKTPFLAIKRDRNGHALRACLARQSTQNTVSLEEHYGIRCIG
jgi:hypothetical protein